MNENHINFKPFCRVMEKLCKKVVKVSESIPDLKLEEINSLEDIPRDKREYVENQLWDIFVYGEYFIRYYINKTRSDLFIKPKVPTEVKKHMDYYRTKYKSFIDKTKKLIDVSKAPSRHDVETTIVHLKRRDILTYRGHINEYMGEYEYRAEQGWLRDYVKENIQHGIEYYDSSENRNIKNSFETILGATTVLHDYVTNPESRLIDSMEKAAVYVSEDSVEGWEEEEEELWRDQVLACLPEDLSNYHEAITKSYFEPDEWIANEKDFPAYFCVTETLEPHVLNRILEIHTSFIFGHWMSVIALSRCLLEYALIEKVRSLEIQPDYKSKGHPKLDDLSDLCKKIEKLFPALKKSMKFIRTEGNRVMHPPEDEEIKNFPANKKVATRCIKEIAKIITTLYSSKES